MLELNCCSLAARGLYYELQRLPAGFWAPLKALARLVGSSVRELKRLFGELVSFGLAAVDGDRWQILKRAAGGRPSSTERVRKHRQAKRETPVATPDETQETRNETPVETPVETPPAPKRGFERVDAIFKRARAASCLASESLASESFKNPTAASSSASCLAPDPEISIKGSEPEAEPIPKKAPVSERSPEYEVTELVYRLVPHLGIPPTDLAGDILHHSPNGLEGVLEAFRAAGIEKRIHAGYRVEQHGFFVSMVRGHFARRARAS